ncbi:MAG: hypothetical protein RMM51_07355 [Verrucomicrobiae bacterium]|nr:hypothetical protein [Verrucomicrobiae bacterium]
MQRRRVKPISRWKRWRHRFEVVLVDAAGWLGCRLSRGAVRRLGEWLGALMFLLLRNERRIALANLELAFGDAFTEAQRRRIARASFRNVYGTLAGLLWAPRLRGDDLRRWVENGEVFAQACTEEKGRGRILLTLHYGDWELLGLAAAAFGLPMTVVAREMRNEALAERLRAVRELTGNRVIPQAGAVRKLYQTLRAGGTVAMLADLNGRMRGGGVWVKFFGLPVFNTASVAALALRTGAVVAVFVAEPLSAGRVRIRSLGRVDYEPSGDSEADVVGLTQRYMDMAEAVIREHPEWWMWSYRRWRYRLSPERGRYPFYSVYRPMMPVARVEENGIPHGGTMR